MGTSRRKGVIMTGMEIALGIVNLGLAAVAYFFKEAHNDIKNRITKLEDNSVRRDDFKDFKNELFARFDRLEEKFKGQ
jgi:hypothetical protein